MKRAKKLYNVAQITRGLHFTLPKTWRAATTEACYYRRKWHVPQCTIQWAFSW